MDEKSWLLHCTYVRRPSSSRRGTHKGQGGTDGFGGQTVPVERGGAWMRLRVRGESCCFGRLLVPQSGSLQKVIPVDCL